MSLSLKKIWIGIFTLATCTILYKQKRLPSIPYAIVTCIILIYLLIKILKSGKTDKITAKYTPLWVQSIHGWTINNKNFYGKIFYIILIILLLIFMLLVIFFKFPLRISG
ncbi:hypothetical protein MEPL4_2c01440 [Melissococcus plutonius]|nr:hypothetical protein MEPL_c001970 [Melissococcus plutonius S1]KMT25848.1 hypothetical protein MEPL2_1c01980 [Melissococcus plutonius]KMT27193.1 hypothetical protein MEPL3_1c02250 [Melissococcus plutonius]KMT28294.1 hypothetical protein MEPL1_2c01280 [Melissococcus plutonius]KMT30031.1 hypothetical protein MEPL4_2c01440 [Melissococcus plutonius]